MIGTLPINWHDLFSRVITIPTNYAYFLYYSFLFVLSMQPKPKCEREHDTRNEMKLAILFCIYEFQVNSLTIIVLCIVVEWHRISSLT
jgi:hypothetical protein